MQYITNIENKVRDYLSGNYEVSEVSTIPSVEHVTFGKKAKKMKLCAYCIDLRKSSELLTIHRKQTSGKIHKAFLSVASEVVLNNGGQIRSFNGDGLLAFWPANSKEQISKAVRSALITKWLLDIKLSHLFETYEKLNFGIGIDCSDAYIMRAGISRNNNNNDLIFIGECVNFATAIANQAKSPDHIEISNRTYENLENECIYITESVPKKNMWKDGLVNWKGVDYQSKTTSYYMYYD